MSGKTPGEMTAEERSVAEAMENHDKHYWALVQVLKRKRKGWGELADLIGEGSTVAKAIWQKYVDFDFTAARLNAGGSGPGIKKCWMCETEGNPILRNGKWEHHHGDIGVRDCLNAPSQPLQPRCPKGCVNVPWLGYAPGTRRLAITCDGCRTEWAFKKLSDFAQFFKLSAPPAKPAPKEVCCGHCVDGCYPTICPCCPRHNEDHSTSPQLKQVAREIFKECDDLYQRTRGYHESSPVFSKYILAILQRHFPGSEGVATRFEEFDDAEHPANKWWQKHGQFMMSGGGRRQFIWACRGWIAREQLLAGVEVTGDSLHEGAAGRPVAAADFERPKCPKCGEWLGNVALWSTINDGINFRCPKCNHHYYALCINSFAQFFRAEPPPKKLPSTCPAISELWSCSLAKGHSGSHQAYESHDSRGELLETWPSPTGEKGAEK